MPAGQIDATPALPGSCYGMQLPSHWEAFGAIWRYRGKPSVSAASSIAARMGYRVNCSAGRAGSALINVSTGETVLAYGDLDVKRISRKTLNTLATEMIVDSNNASYDPMNVCFYNKAGSKTYSRSP